MLINNFFNLSTITNTDQSILATIKLSASHKIFKGHFPNNPVTPGVVQIQLVKELLEHQLNKKITLKEVGRCKFLAILNPNENPEIEVKIDYSFVDENLKVSAHGFAKNNSQSFFKFTAKYV